MKVTDEIIKIAEAANTRAELITILAEHNIVLSDPEINELCVLLDIPHGYNCPCCTRLYMPPKNKDNDRKILPRPGRIQ